MTDLTAVLARLDKITPGRWSVGCVRLTQPPAIGHGTRLLEFGPKKERIGLVYFDMKTALGQADASAIALLPELIAVAKAAAELRRLEKKFGIDDLGAAEVREKLLDAALSALAQRGKE